MSSAAYRSSMTATLVALAYGGWPDRLYLVGRDGRIAFQGGVGPDGFKPEELAAAVESELGGANVTQVNGVRPT